MRLGVCLRDNHNLQNLGASVGQCPQIEELGMQLERSNQRKAFQHGVSIANGVHRPCQHHEVLLVVMMEEVECCGAGCRIKSRLVWWHYCHRCRSWEG